MKTAEQLRLVALIGETGSLAGAADELHLTAAAVTQRLTRAEDEWGTPLVERGPRGASLTDAGRVLAQHGHRVHTEVLRAQEALDEWWGDKQRRLRIGAFQAAALHLLPPALTALRHRDATADISVVDIQSVNGPDLVADGDLDLAVIAAWDNPPQPPPGVELQRLMLDPMVLVLPEDHPTALNPKPKVRLRDLAQEAWVVIRAGSDARSQFDRATHTAGFTPLVRFETESYDVAQALVGTGYGVALVSRLALTGIPGTTHRQLTDTTLHRTLYAAIRENQEGTPLVAAFTALLLNVASDLTQGWD